MGEALLRQPAKVPATVLRAERFGTSCFQWHNVFCLFFFALLFCLYFFLVYCFVLFLFLKILEVACFSLSHGWGISLTQERALEDSWDEHTWVWGKKAFMLSEAGLNKYKNYTTVYQYALCCRILKENQALGFVFLVIIFKYTLLKKIYF